jgi:hypothetical protein
MRESKRDHQKQDEDHGQAGITDDGVDSDYDDVSDAGDGPAFVDEDNTANNDDDFPEKGAHAKPDPDSGYRLT